MKKINSRGFAHLFLLLIIVVAIAVVGTYLLVQSRAASPALSHLPTDNPARGLRYAGLILKNTGPCAGEFVAESEASNPKPACNHPDPGPDGVDVRVRDKQVDSQLAQQAAYDKSHPALDASADQSKAPPPLLQSDDIQSAGSLSAVSPVNWKCIGDGSGGDRVVVVYAYPNGNSRFNTVSDNITSIAKRVNGVMVDSSGGNRSLRFATNPDCSLVIRKVAISGDISSFSNIRSTVKAAGLNSVSRKYLVMVDGGSGVCGSADSYQDDNSSPTANYNNGASGSQPMYAVVWHPCWNYGEPHELMHTLGAVSKNAPHATSRGHCYDQHDVMCYNDGSGTSMQLVCTNSAALWKYDCNRNDYFNAGSSVPTWLSNHWNTANSYWLAH